MHAANSTRTNQVCHMNAIVRRTIASIATAILSMGLISACADREEGQKMRHCSGTIIDLPSAIWAPVIDGVPFLVVNGAKATVIAGTPQADIRVYWLNGDNGLFACKGVGGVGVGRSGPECRWRRGRRAHPAASRAQVRMEGCGGEWFGVPVPRLFLFVGALHPIRRQCTSSVRVHRHVTGAPPRNGCSALRACGGCGGCRGCGGLLCLSCLLLGALRGAFVASHVVVPQKCRMQFPHTYFKR